MGQITLNAWGKVATITYPDDMDNLAPVAFAAAYGYEENLMDDGDEVPNPQSVEEFTIEKIFDYVGDVMRTHGVRDAQEQARLAALESMDNQLGQIVVDIQGE